MGNLWKLSLGSQSVCICIYIHSVRYLPRSLFATEAALIFISYFPKHSLSLPLLSIITMFVPSMALSSSPSPPSRRSIGKKQEVNRVYTPELDERDPGSLQRPIRYRAREGAEDGSVATHLSRGITPTETNRFCVYIPPAGHVSVLSCCCCC